MANRRPLWSREAFMNTATVEPANIAILVRDFAIDTAQQQATMLRGIPFTGYKAWLLKNPSAENRARAAFARLCDAMQHGVSTPEEIIPLLEAERREELATVKAFLKSRV